MQLPNLYPVQTGRSIQTAFGGLNETYACAEMELSETMNMSARGYPALETRSPRRQVRELDQCGGMYHLNGMLTIRGTALEYVPDSGEAVVIEDAVSAGDKILVGMGSRVLIWPDAKSYDTASGLLEPLAAQWAQADGQAVTITPCDAAGNTYVVDDFGRTEPESPTDGEIFLKVNDLTKPWEYVSVLEKYSVNTRRWTQIVLNRLRIELPGIGSRVKKGDTVTLLGLTQDIRETIAEDAGGEVNIEQMDGDALICSVTPNTESDLYYGKFVIQDTGRVQWTSIDGHETMRMDSTAPRVTMERRVPDLEYVTEDDNRVWGCNSRENTIYCCKLGDPTNWYSYRGIASDSYAVNVGSDGPFTGAASCMGYVLFFKENMLHKVYGSKPADYQLVSVRCRGVARGASRSLCVLAEVLYYLSPDGVMAWDGSLPVKISHQLDTARLTNVTRATGAGLDTRYYLYLQAAAGNRLLVYDTEKQIWHEEDANGIGMVSTGRQLYLWDGRAVWAAEPDRETASTAGQTEDAVEFWAVTGDIGLGTPEDKYVSRVTMRIDALARSVVRVEASYDGGPWKPLGETVTLDGYTRVNLPLRPARHDTMRLRIAGRGQIALRSLAFTMAAGEGNRTAGAVPHRGR